MKLLFLILCAILTGCEKKHSVLGISGVQDESKASRPAIGSLSVFFVEGQSNALGLGQYSASPLPPGVIWRGLDMPRGIGVSFGQEYLRLTGRPAVIIAQCSEGATSIHEWQPGGFLQSRCLGIYENIKRDYPNAVPAGVLFWQGERDATATADPDTAWAFLFQSAMKGFRWNLNDLRLPVIYCQLSVDSLPGSYPSWSYIKSQQADVYLNFAEMVRTDDINDVADSVHMGATGLSEVGRRMAAAYWDMVL